jgi:hypothetical protein
MNVDVHNHSTLAFLRGIPHYDIKQDSNFSLDIVFTVHQTPLKKYHVHLCNAFPLKAQCNDIPQRRIILINGKLPTPFFNNGVDQRRL